MVVVLDPMAPISQTQEMVDESRCRLILHDDTCAGAAADLAAAAAHQTAPLALRGLDGDPTEAAACEPGAPAMLAFTSGTSGGPKGAVITHGLLLNLVRGATNALGIGPSDRMPMLFPTSMAVAAYPMFLPLLNGGTLATLDVRSVGLAPIGPFLEDEGITLAYLAPTVVRFLTDALGGRTFPDLRMVALGGEGIDGDAVELTRRLFRPHHVGLGYGTTETGVVCLGVLPGEGPALDEVSCGYAVPEVELFVLDDVGRLLPPGESGEIAVAGPHLFDGYMGHPELDAQVLTADPRGRDGWRMYRTGDHGRVDEQGALVVMGRLDTKVKVRGRFVVLGDVEAALHALDEIDAAAVVAATREGLTELVAYVVPAGEDLDPSVVRSHLLETNDAYRVPTRWVVLDELPRLPNGKTDRRALPPVDLGPSPVGTRVATGSAAEGSAVAGDSVQREITSVWEALLPVDRVEPDQDFADLGGDSLLAAQMLVVLEQRLGVTVPMGELVHARTVRTLTEVVRRLRSSDGEPSTAANVQDGVPDRPILWFVHDLQGSAYRVRHVAAALGTDQPVWSFESPLLRGEPNRFTSLETFAANYLTDLRAVQPEGPYWLGGYSFGGVCAYEMARQLHRDGQEVAFLGVVDVGPGYRGPGWHAHRSPFRPWFGVAKPPEPGAPLAEQARHYLEMARSGPGRLARHLMVRSGVSRVVDPLRFRSDLRTHGRVRPAWRLWYAWEEHWKLAATAWDRGSSYDGELDLFWADDTPSSDATLGWGPLVGDLRIHRFPGDHMGVLEPAGAPALAAALRRVLDERLGG
jgi:acyl-coenzyme A synthetase/AMP-(fatty) acid ligase/thioesterase domain-containing protein/acyl carrier protein